MVDVTPTSPTLQGIPPELRNKIYDYLALTTPRNVSGSKLVQLRRSRGGDIRKQFQSATAVHPLTLTCRQMRTEFSSVLAMTAGQSYCLIVDNLDLPQLTVFREFAATCCSSHRVSDENFPPVLLRDIMLCLKLDSDILGSAASYCLSARSLLGLDYGNITGAFPEVTIMSEADSSLYDNSTSKNKSMSKA